MNEKLNETGLSSDTRPQALTQLGWDSWFSSHMNTAIKDKGCPGRIVGVRKNNFLVSQGYGVTLATVSGRLHYRSQGEFPVTGDWVILDNSVITRVIPRKNALTRSASGTRGKQGVKRETSQIIAANLDTVFIVCGLDRDFNVRRLERYLTLVYNCGLTPAIVLTKADLHEFPENFASEVETVAFGVPVHLVSALDSSGTASLSIYLTPGRTIAMIGSSGAGKSTLLNTLYGKKIQAANGISDVSGKGRHTTTSRTLFTLPQGGMVIDNPGIREIGLWDMGNGLETTFPEIKALAEHCRFHDCTHTHEPGCRIREAVSDGTLRAGRLRSYHKMKRELEFIAEREHKSADRLEKERWKDVSLKIRTLYKGRRNS